MIDIRCRSAERGRRTEQPAGREYPLRRTQQDPYRNSATMAADALRQSACTASGLEEAREQRPCRSPERCRVCRCRTRPACHAPPDRRGSTESNQMPIPRRRTAAASTGSSHHRRKPIACTVVRGPQIRRAPSRRFAPARPNNRAAGAAGAGRKTMAAILQQPIGDHPTAQGLARDRAT